MARPKKAQTTGEKRPAGDQESKMGEQEMGFHRFASMEEHPLTFAAMFRDRENFSHLKLPDWLFPRTYARHEQASLTPTQQQRFLCALNVVMQNGTFGQLVDIHAVSSHHMHGTLRFLPWHRIYLLQLEHALQAIHPDVSIPYWDWTKSSQQSFPTWLQGVTPNVVTPTQTIQVIRSPGSHSDLAMIASNTSNILQLNTLPSFTSQLEGVHGAVHVWVGGSMGSIPTAPADPIFWMHHANIDRLWWLWQTSSHGLGKNPALAGADAVMDPWPSTETDTRDIGVLGYNYA